MNSKKAQAREKLMVALDVAALDEVARAVDMLADSAGWFKVGSQLFTAEGPEVVEIIKATGAKVFLDLKYHDIPNTVSLAGRAAASLGVDLFNVHALGGVGMMSAVVKEVTDHCKEQERSRPRIIAVTVLTSMKEEDLRDIGVEATAQEMALRLAALARKSGLDGVVASAHEVRAIKEKVGEDFLVVTPGVRPAWAAANDQKRVMTPAEAIREGADYLVVGRPIMKAKDPAEAARRVLEEIEFAI